MKYIICAPWHKQEIKDAFMEAWGLDHIPHWLLLEQDIDKIGCANMKNKLIAKAFTLGAEVIGVLDSDCHPVDNMNLQDWIEGHMQALNDQPVEMFESVAFPQSRGTPYYNKTITMPVAASMGFWEGEPDWDAPSQLVRGSLNEAMLFNRKPIFGKYFAFCGMNFAFKTDWIQCAELIDIERMDDIWMGFIWQKIAYENHYCFNLNGPLVYHSRQSNVWHNLNIESQYLKINETLWQKIHSAPRGLSHNSLKMYLHQYIQQCQAK